MPDEKSIFATSSEGMLAVIRQAVNQLEPDICDSLEAFLMGQWTAEGGARNRAGTADLYYTVFLLECCRSMDLAIPRKQVLDYLMGFGAGKSLDFVHRACLARCRGVLSETHSDTKSNAELLDGLEEFRLLDGGYNQNALDTDRCQDDPLSGSLYDGFLALMAWDALGAGMPHSPEFLQWLKTIRPSEGGYGNDAGFQAPTTPVTAGAVMLLTRYGFPIASSVGDWLMNQHQGQGGFLAAPMAPMPDLLSTATALHALHVLQRSMEEKGPACLEFVETLWADDGGFRGYLEDDQADVEYTYYGLLALGHLARESA
jgi:hypothetical protein